MGAGNKRHAITGLNLEDAIRNHVNDLWQHAEIDASDRSKGAFKRAFWYGTSGSGFTGLIKEKTVGAKGVRKILRNAPKGIITKGPKMGVTAAAAVVGLPFIPITIPAIVVIEKIADKYEAIVEKMIPIVKEKVYRPIKGKFKKKPEGSNNTFRKSIKKDVKELKEGKTLIKIDRNLVKLKDAQKAVGPKIRDMETAFKKMKMDVQRNVQPNKNDFDKGTDKSIKALRGIAEIDHYLDKEMTLVKSLVEAFEKLNENLESLKKGHVKLRDDTMDSIINFQKAILT